MSGIRHQYDQRIVLSDVNTMLEKNQVTAILGKSGSGKSTLLKIINGLVRPAQGSVKVLGEVFDANNMGNLRLQIGYVVQQVGLFPHMTVQQNIGLLGRICERSNEEIEARTNHLLKLVQLPSAYLSKYPHELSGGEQQRVGICRGMFLNPTILLMDEPFGSLDYETKRHIYKQLLGIQHHEPRTIVLVTHDWDEAITLADQFLWIEDGSIRAQGDKNNLRDLKTSIFG